MAYNNRYQQPASLQSNSLSPARFAQNPTRTRSTRWTAAKTVNYDGDGWGDDDYDDDDYNDNIYTSSYRQPTTSAHQYGSNQQGNQEFTFSRSSTQPLLQPSSRFETEEDPYKPLIRQGTSPAVPPTQRYSTSSGIQRKPSKMDRNNSVQQQVQQVASEPMNEATGVQSTQPSHDGATNREARFPETGPPGSVYPPQQPQPTSSPQIAKRPLSFEGNEDTVTAMGLYTQSAADQQPATFSETTANEGFTTPTKEPSSPTTQSPSQPSPTLRRPADIYAAAMRRSLEMPPIITVDASSPADDEKSEDLDQQLAATQAEASQTAGSATTASNTLSDEEGTAASVYVNFEPGDEPAPLRVGTPNGFVTQEPPNRNSHLFLDVNTDDDINRNIRLITPSPSQPGHFLTVPEPTHESPNVSYDDSDEEEKLGLFHTSTPPQRESPSPPTSTTEFGFEQTNHHVETHDESPVEPQTSEPLPDPQLAAGISISRTEATSPSDYGAQHASSRGSPFASSTPPPQSITQKVSDAATTVSSTFSSLISNAFNIDGGGSATQSPVVTSRSPPPQTGDQTASALSVAEADASQQTPAGAQREDRTAEAVHAPENTSLQPADSTVVSRETTPAKFEDDDEEEVTIEEARRVEWGTPTHVAIQQSPTKTPSQSPPPADVSQPLITKATEPVIHTPQPTSSQTEQPTIITAHPFSDRAVSPVSHASSSIHSKSPSLAAAGLASVQPTDRRSPQPISFADFIKRSPQSTPIGHISPSPATSSSPAPAAPAPAAPVSFKAFMNNRANPMPEPDRSTPPAPSFKAFLSQKAPPGQVNAPEPQGNLPGQTTIEPLAAAPDEPLSGTTAKMSPSDEGESLRQAILKKLEAESQPQTPVSPSDPQRDDDLRFDNQTAASMTSGPEPTSPIVGRNPSYKGKLPQRSASVAISDVSEDRYHPQPFENAQYPRFSKHGANLSKQYPPPPASDISAPSKSGDDEGVFTPPPRSVAGENAQDYEPSIQEDRGYQPSITSDQYVPSPMDTVHQTVKPFQIPNDFSEIPTLLNLSDILALSDAKDRIAASEKARRIHANQGMQGSHDLQVWLQHVQQLNQQNTDLWEYNRTRPGMHDLRGNPLISGRFEGLAQHNHSAHEATHHKWKAWGRLDDGVAGSRPSTAATDDYMAPQKPLGMSQNQQPPPQGHQQLPPPSNQDNQQNRPPQVNPMPPHPASQSQGPSQAPSTKTVDFVLHTDPKSGGQSGQANGSHVEAMKQEDHAGDKKKQGLGKKLRGIWGRKKDKGDSHVAESSPVQPSQAALPQQTQTYQPVPVPVPMPLPQNEKYPPNAAHPGAQSAPVQSATTPQDIKHPQQLPPPQQNKGPMPKQEEFLPPLPFQQGSKSPDLRAVMNMSNSTSDLLARSQQQNGEPAAQTQKMPPGPSGSLQSPGGQQPPTPVSISRRPTTSGDAQGPPPPRTFDDNAPPPLRRISNSKPPPPRMRTTSIPATVQEGNQHPGGLDPSHSQDNFMSTGVPGAHPQQHGGPGVGQPHLRPQDTASGYEPSVTMSENSVTSDATEKKSRFSVLGKLKNQPVQSHPSGVAPLASENAGSPRGSIHTTTSQPSATDKRNSFLGNQWKKFDQMVVGKEQQQGHPQHPTHNGQGIPQGHLGPDPGINRQQSFPTDSSSSIQAAPEGRKKGRFGKLISDLKTIDPLGRTDQTGHDKPRKGSFFGKSHTENAVVSSVPPTSSGGQPQPQAQAYQPQQGQAPQGQAPVWDPNQNVVVPIPGQYHSVSQDSQIQTSNSGYANGTAVAPNQVQPTPQTANAQAPTPQSQPAYGSPSQISRKNSNPPPPAARFLAVPPSPPPLAKRTKLSGYGQTAPVHEEESLYSSPVVIKSGPPPLRQTNEDGPPPLRPHQKSSPSPPPRIVYAPPPQPVTMVSNVAPVQSEPIKTHYVEQPQAPQTTRYPEQETKVPSPVLSKDKAPEPSPDSSGFVMTEIVLSPPSQPTPEPRKVEAPKAEPPRVEVTPASATETEISKSEPVAAPIIEVTPTQTESPKAEPPKAEPVKAEPPKAEASQPKEEPSEPQGESNMQGESSGKAASPEPPQVVHSNEDFDKIAVDPEGPVPEEEERIVMSATTSPGFNDWEYF
ncbi:hypothetical protein TWF696_005263 [Orbilia brochopaga]|uniref:Uncharacterized protein n=1 Tax=Orbilia brochopaga TaxID=3140254 RepID=A0AAV9V3G6_9PEZI